MTLPISWQEMLLIGSIPMLIVGLIAAYYKWRDDHPRRHAQHHPAE